MARCGKDTFAEILNKFIPTRKYSSIDKVKDIARECGWNGEKDEVSRKFLSDLKVLTSEYNDMPFNAIKNEVSKFNQDNNKQVLLIDIREPAEIHRAKNVFNAKTILIKNDRVKQINSNMADANVYNYDYDYVVENNGTLKDFRDNIELFCREVFDWEQ